MSLKKIAIAVETDAKHILLHFDEIEPLAVAALGTLGKTRAAAFLAELVTLAKAAETAYDDASAVAITPQHVAALLPDPTPLAPPQPATAPAAAAAPAAPAEAAAPVAAPEASAKA